MPWGVNIYGPGWEQVRVQVPAPGAGLDWSLTVPNGELWIPVGFTCKLQADLNAATRVLSFVATRDGVEWYWVCSDVELTVADSVVIRATSGGTDVETTLASVIKFIRIPGELILEPGDSFASSTRNIQVGDTYSAIAISYKRWHIPAEKGVDGASGN